MIGSTIIIIEREITMWIFGLLLIATGLGLGINNYNGIKATDCFEITLKTILYLMSLLYIIVGASCIF